MPAVLRASSTGPKPSTHDTMPPVMIVARTASIMSVNEVRTGWFGLARIDEDWANDPRAALNSNRAADTATGGETAPQDKVGSK